MKVRDEKKFLIVLLPHLLTFRWVEPKELRLAKRAKVSQILKTVNALTVSHFVFDPHFFAMLSDYIDMRRIRFILRRLFPPYRAILHAANSRGLYGV